MYGVIVVPTTATMRSRIPEPDGIDGMTSAWPTAPQSGRARIAETTYAANASAVARKTLSTVRSLANRTRAQIATATSGTVTTLGTPKISSAAVAPENSATVLATFATSSTSIA